MRSARLEDGRLGGVQALVQDFGMDVTPAKYGEFLVELTIPLDHVDPDSALMAHDDEPLDAQLNYGATYKTAEAW